MKAISYYLLFIAIVALTSCGGGDEYEDGYYDKEPTKQFIKNPIDDLIRDMSNETTFSIILHDMDVKEDEKGTSYQHQYRIITAADTIADAEPNLTDWMPVSEEMFWDQENNMGMEVASKSADGEISKVAAPPGYSNYVGNQKYGSWQTNNSGQSYWAWYGRYAFMSTMFHTAMYPVYRYDYMTYSSYRGYNRPYYGGTSSNPKYGTNSSLNKSTKPNFFSRKASSTAWKSSAQRKTSTGYSSKSYGSSSTSTSKNTSRYSSSSSSSSSSYSSGSSYRSSGGSYGK